MGIRYNLIPEAIKSTGNSQSHMHRNSGRDGCRGYALRLPRATGDSSYFAHYMMLFSFQHPMPSFHYILSALIWLSEPYKQLYGTLAAFLQESFFLSGSFIRFQVIHPCMGFLAVVAQTYTCPEKNLEGGSTRPDAFIG
ncbi:MAG TPA: hypothetical protein P5054_00875 [Desulfomonilia bacterium]|nr:hypothetical protein [Desulfomonilia bacterium]